jgi:hypothetical protein
MPTVDVNDVHDTWLQTTDEAIWREVHIPAYPIPTGDPAYDLPRLEYVHMETGEVVTPKQIFDGEIFFYLEDVIWCQEDFTDELIRAFLRAMRKIEVKRNSSKKKRYKFFLGLARTSWGLEEECTIIRTMYV